MKDQSNSGDQNLQTKPPLSLDPATQKTGDHKEYVLAYCMEVAPCILLGINSKTC